MNNIQKLALTSLVFTGLIMGVPFVSAEPVLVNIPIGTGTQGCEETDECYIPAHVTVHPKDEIVWSNVDAVGHTVTSGTPPDADGTFDSGLLSPLDTFSHTFDTLGAYPYYCIVHPWMVGEVFVTVGGGVEIDLGTITADEQTETTMGAITIEGKSETETTVHGLSEDGKVRIEIVASNPIADEAMSLDLKFRDSSGGGLKKHANYDIVVTQNGKEIFSESEGHNHEGNAMYTTIPLESEDPVDIQLTLLGFGLPDEKENWTGPKGEVLMFNVVPEFDTIAMMILAVGIISIIVVTAKSKVMPKLYN